MSRPMVRPSLHRCVEERGLPEFSAGHRCDKQRRRGDGFVQGDAHVDRYAFILVLDRLIGVLGDDHG
jgi:hypothetical protein